MPEVASTQKLQKKREGRSPAYPYIPVQKAIERVHELFAQESTHNAPLSSALGAWGYSPKSSGGRQTLATMKYYGLIDVSGEGDARMIKVSEIARKIILDKREDDSERRTLIRQVALMPSAHKTIYQKYPDGLPSDGTVHHYLVFERGFNADAANELLTEFKLTASQVHLYQPDGAVDKGSEKEHIPADGPSDINVGDKVQVTVGGVDQFPDGAKVLGFSDDGAWVFIDQSKSAAKLEEVTLLNHAVAAPVAERPEIPAHLLQPRDTPPPKGSRKAVFPLSDGDVVLTYQDGISDASLKRLKKYLEIFLDEQIELTEGTNQK
jgi:hypothetical protein